MQKKIFWKNYQGLIKEEKKEKEKREKEREDRQLGEGVVEGGQE